MSGPKPVRLCPSCRYLSDNGKVCHAFVTHPFKKGVCTAYEPKGGVLAGEGDEGGQAQG